MCNDESLFDAGVQVIIPARLASTRLPRKLLRSDTGKTLLQHTYDAVARAGLIRTPIIAVDSEELFAVVKQFGGTAVMTSPLLASGTDRVAAVAESLNDAHIIVNVQADEPEISPDSIHRLIHQLKDNPDVPMATLAAPLASEAELFNPACVKVVRSQQGRALYFSRAPIPFARDGVQTLFR
jgi:3-deoxy-manno-octulosonate cytidylyltransferase (CMP-KDO synthetase)